MEWKDLIPLVEKAAPLIGSLLGGPAGATVGSLLAAGLGKPSAKPDDLAQQINTDPDIQVKLAQIQAQHVEALQQLQLQSLQQKEQSLQNARASLDDLKLKARVLDMFGFGLLFFFAVIVLCMFQTINISPGEAGLIASIGGILNLLWKGIQGFFFGSY